MMVLTLIELSSRPILVSNSSTVFGRSMTPVVATAAALPFDRPRRRLALCLDYIN